MFVKRAIVLLVTCAVFMMPAGAVLGQTIEPVDDGYMDMPMMEMWWPEPGNFDYENGTVTGTYLNFELDEATGTIEDYTVTISTVDMMFPYLLYQENSYVGDEGEVFVEETFPEFNWTTENIIIFDSIEIEGFVPVGQPGTFSDMFLFMGEDVLMMFYDFEGAYSSYTSDDENVTFTFQVAEDFEVSRFPYYDYYVQEWNDSEDWEGDYPSDPDDDRDLDTNYSGDLYWPPYSWDEVWIEYNGTTTSIWIQNGLAEIDNNTVTIELGPSGRIDISTWAEMPYFDYYMEPWDDDWEYEEDRGLIDTAIEDGVLAAVGYLFAEGGEEQWSNSNYYDDPTFQMEFTDVEENLIEIEVDSRIPEGRIVSINLNQGALNISELGELLVKLDGTPIEAYDTLEELTELVGGPEAGYYVLFGDSGNTVFVYVPHFSTHTITLENVLSSMPNILVPTVLAAVFIAVTTLAIIMRGRRNQDDF